MQRKLARSSILEQIQEKLNMKLLRDPEKQYFEAIFGPFSPFSGQQEFSQVWNLHRKLAHNMKFHFRPNSVKINDITFDKP